jgi:hypothetical protein
MTPEQVALLKSIESNPIRPQFPLKVRSGFLIF